MQASLALVTFILGSIVGSFLNVVALRYNTGKGVAGRSVCMSCGKNLVAHELIPIASFILQLGRCRGCKTKLSWQYPLVELITGLVFFAVFLKFYPIALIISPVVIPFWYIVFSILIVISIYDLKHSIIPDALSYSFIIISALFLFSSYSLENIIKFPVILDLLAGPIFFSIFGLLWLVSKGRWIGFGDAKLVLGMGFALGFSGGLSALAIGFWIGAIFSLIMMFLHKLKFVKLHLHLNTEIPFAPFLILGFFIAFYFGVDVFSVRDLLLL